MLMTPVQRFSSVEPYLETQDPKESLKNDDAVAKVLQAFSGGLLHFQYVKDGWIRTLSKKEEIAPLIESGFRLVFNQASRNFFLTRGLLGGSPTVQAIESQLEQLPATKPAVFISYNWEMKEEAIEIEKAFKDFYVIRDENHLKDGSNPGEFMKLVKHPRVNYVVVIVSAKYLQSENCMNEVHQLFQKYNFETAIVPYVITNHKEKEKNADIYNDSKTYEDHWTKLIKPDSQKKRLEECLAACTKFIEHLRFNRINTKDTELQANGYQGLINIINNKRTAGAQFDAIEAALSAADGYEKSRDFVNAELNYKLALSKLTEVFSHPQRNQICAKAHFAYSHFLEGQAKRQEAITELIIATTFGQSHERIFSLLKGIDFTSLQELDQKAIINWLPQFSWETYQALPNDLKQLISNILTKTEIQIDSQVQIGSQVASLIASAIGATVALTKCYLRNPHIYGDALAQLVKDGFEKNTTITVLDLGENKLTSEDAKTIAHLLELNTPIAHLTLGKDKASETTRNGLESKGAKAIAEALKSNNRLKELDFGDNKIDLSGVQCFFEVLESNKELCIKFSNILVGTHLDEDEQGRALRGLHSYKQKHRIFIN